MPVKNFFSQLSKTYIIAEIGVNHNGSLSLAKEMILSAKNSGADAVKFQTYSAERLVAPGTPKVKYQEDSSSSNETHFEMLKKLELSKNDHIELFEFCKKNEINFLSTPYDIESAKFLKQLGVNLFKTASADIIDLPLHEYIASTKIPSIIATGMATISEIKKVIQIYEKINNNDFIILHCVSNYPCSDSSLNMNVMNNIDDKFNCSIGYSDHSIGFLASVIAVSKGAKLIEKHFTTDKLLPGPDHKASSSPDEFKELVKNIRRTERMLGNSDKCMQKEEQEMSKVSRKSIFLSKDLNKDSVIKISDLSLMRPGDGILASDIKKVEGMKINKDLEKGKKLAWDDLDS
jgi:N-acetylneuraminate synthase/N,N'-diacetyllegionaminate synthase